MATIGAYKGVDITGGTDAEVAAQMKNIDTQAITPQSFDSTAPAKATQQPVSTAADGLSETLAATADTYNQDRQKEAETARKGKQSSLESLVQNMLGADGQTTLTAKEYADTGVNTAEADVKDINSQIMSEQRALDKQIRALKENKQGLFGGALEQEIDRVRGESLTRQADLAIVQMARQGKYDSAKAIADRAVAAKLERQAQITEALKLSYQENKELFTKAEQRAFESAQKDRERKLAMEDYKERARFDDKIAAQKSLRETAAGASGAASGAGYANDLDAVIGATLSTIGTKFGQQTFNAQIARARNDADKINLVAAQVLKNAPAELKNDFRNQAVGISQLDKAIAELDAGVQTGAIAAGQQYVYNLAGKDFDPKLATINSYITSAIQPYRNSVTGAAWGDQEDAEYQQLFGSTKYSPQELRQRLVQTKELLKSKSATGLDSFVNPLGTYDNQFATGSLAPSAMTPTVTPDDEAIFSNVVGDATGGGGGFWSSFLSGLSGN